MMHPDSVWVRNTIQHIMHKSMHYPSVEVNQLSIALQCMLPDA